MQQVRGVADRAEAGGHDLIGGCRAKVAEMDVQRQIATESVSSYWGQHALRHD